MKLHFGLLALLACVIGAVPARAQSNPLRGSQPSAPAVQPLPPTAQPDQPVQPQTPVIVPRIRQLPAEQPAVAQQPQPPFTLTAEEEAQVDQVLKQWEQRNKDIKTFDCDFKRWIYDFVFNPPAPNKPLQAKSIDSGVIQYAAPDRGKFFAEGAEQWICDGKSIYEFSPPKKQVIEHKLPPEVQGKAIANSPLPFLFGAEAASLKQRYFIRIITPPNETTQIWLEAYPRFQQDKANFDHAIFIIKIEGMSPFALKLIQPNGKDYTTYQFYNIVVNDPLRLFKGDPFKAHVPLGWQMVPDDGPPAAQARRAGDGGQR